MLLMLFEMIYFWSAVITAHPPTSTSQEQQQQQQTRVMHQIATQSKDPITKAVATNIVGAQKQSQVGGTVRKKMNIICWILIILNYVLLYHLRMLF